MATAQICIREKGSNICPFHPGKEVVHECNNCKTLVCPLCITAQHKKHSLRTINSAVYVKKEKIKSYIQKKKRQTLPELIKELKGTTEELQDNNQEYEDVIIKAKKQGERLKAEIDKHTVKTVSRLKFLQKRNNRILERHLVIIETLQSQLEKRIKDCEFCMSSVSDIEVYDSELPSDYPVVIPNYQSLISTSFTPCTATEEYLKNLAFGEILEFKISKPANISPEQSAPKKSTKIVTQYKLIKQPKTLHEHATSYGILLNSICPAPDNMVWTRRAVHDNKLYLMDDKGAQHRTLEADVNIRMMSVYPVTGEFYCSCYNDNSIRRINTATGKTTVMFYTQPGDKPLAIGCLDGDRMVVSYGDKDYNVKRDMNNLGLSVYTIAGTLLSSYTYFGRFRFLTVCPQTNTIALMSGEQVTVLDETLQEVYTYEGEGVLHEQFKCVTAVFVGEYLLVGDCRNLIIHILSAATGKLIKSIRTDSMSEVVALAVQHNGVLWVGCMEPNKLLHIQFFE